MNSLPQSFFADPKGQAMTDPLDKATSKAPPTLGEGCLSRYDPDALSPEDGTEFEGAQQLWEQLKPEAQGDENSGSFDPK
jgi:hypothetical protein